MRRLAMATEEGHTKDTKSMKYYYLHREEILEKRRAKKLEDPEFKAKQEEKARIRAEKEAEAERRKAEKEAKRKQVLEAFSLKDAKVAELKLAHQAEIRKLAESLAGGKSSGKESDL